MTLCGSQYRATGLTMVKHAAEGSTAHLPRATSVRELLRTSSVTFWMEAYLDSALGLVAKGLVGVICTGQHSDQHRCSCKG